MPAPSGAARRRDERAASSGRDQALTPWFAARSGRLSARCNVVCIGDSITEGVHAAGPPSTGFASRWVSRLADMLRARYPTHGLTGGGRGFIGAASSGETSFTWPATMAGGPVTGESHGPKAKSVQLGAAGQSITFTLAGDSADIMWTQAGGGGSFSWAVDGGPAATVPTGGSGTVDGKITHISLGGRGAHTLVLARVSGTSTIDGVIEYDGDYSGGIQVHDAGHFGWQTSNWLTALNGGAASGPAAAIAALKPAAVIISLGSNDQFSGVCPATFRARLQAIIAALQARLASPFPAFVLCMLPPRAGQSGLACPWDQYVSAAYEVAAADTSGPGGTPVVSVLDFTAIPAMPGADADVDGLWQAGDLVHPSNKGHQMIAERLAAFLAGDDATEPASPRGPTRARGA